MSIKKTILKNTFALLTIKGLDYILPLLLIPFLIRTIGIDQFGLLALATALIAFFRTFVSYGFDLSATEQIAKYRDDKFKVSKIYSAIIIIKFQLILVSLICLAILLSFVPDFNKYWEIYFLTFLIIVGESLFPTWYFQGIEKMKYITYLKIIYKSLFVLSVFFIVESKTDTIYVPLLDSLGYFIIGVISQIYILKNYAIKFTVPNREFLKNQFYNGWHIFLSRITIIMYSSINILILGLFVSTTAVGYFSLAHKIYSAVKELITPFTLALFPYLTRLYNSNYDVFIKKIKLLSVLQFLILFIISVILYLFSDEIIKIISGKNINEVSSLLNILLLSLPLSIGTFYSSLLVIQKKGKILFNITFKLMILNLIMVLPTIYFYGNYGLAYLFVILQIVQFTLQLKANQNIIKIQI